MAWQQVQNYSFGFNTSTKKFWLYFTLKGASSTSQVFLTPTQFSAVVAAFGSATTIQYEDSGKYFATEPG